MEFWLSPSGNEKQPVTSEPVDSDNAAPETTASAHHLFFIESRLSNANLCHCGDKMTRCFERVDNILHSIHMTALLMLKVAVFCTEICITFAQTFGRPGFLVHAWSYNSSFNMWYNAYVVTWSKKMASFSRMNFAV